MSDVSYRPVALALVLSLGSAGLAAGCTVRAGHLAEQARWMLLKGNAQGAEYTSTFDGKYVDQQLVSYQERRSILERAQVWQGGSSALSIIAGLLVAAAYALFLRARLEEQRLETSPSTVQVQ